MQSSNNLQKPKYLFSIIIIGDSQVGKTSLLGQFLQKSELRNPIGVNFHNKEISISDDVRVRLQISNTASQERFRSYVRSYYRNRAAIMIIYDVTCRTSFESVKRHWLKDARNLTYEQEIAYMLIGHKVDLDCKREVPTSEGEAFAEAHDMLFIETSAKVLCNIEEAFTTVAKDIYRRLECGKIKQRDGWDGVIALPSRPLGLHLSHENINRTQNNTKRCCIS